MKIKLLGLGLNLFKILKLYLVIEHVNLTKHLKLRFIVIKRNKSSNKFKK